MIFTKDGLLRLLITVAISALIFTLVSFVFFDFEMENFGLLKSVLLGSAIWFVAEITLEFVTKIWPHNILPSYVVLCFIIVLGTTGGIYLFGIRDIKMIVFINAFAVVCGLTIAVVNRRRYKKKLNKQLKEFKEKQ